MKRDQLISLSVVMILVVGLWAATCCIASNKLPKNPGISDYGQFGDTFGSLNALFSGLAFAGVVWSLFIQREDLNSSIKAQRLHARIAGLAAMLEGKRVLVEQIDITLGLNPAQTVTLPNRPPIALVDIRQRLNQDMIQLNAELDALRAQFDEI